MSLQWEGQRVDTWEFTWQKAIFLLVVSFVVSIVVQIVTVVLILPMLVVAVATLGLALLFLSTIMFSATFWALSLLPPDAITLHGFWWTVLCGAIIGIVRLPAGSSA